MYKAAPEIEAYFSEQYNKQDIRVVPGHWPEMKTKQDVDDWIEILGVMEKIFSCFEESQKND